jgi:arsenate reductase
VLRCWYHPEACKLVINVLFVCIGNSCRSQMAEGFARKYGSDVIAAWSAGLAPAPIVQPLTIEVMRQKNIDIQDQFPKSVHELELNAFDVIFNMSGVPLPAMVRAEVRVWNVMDPMTQPEEVYVRVRDQIEGLVMEYILEVRRRLNREGIPVSAPARPLIPRPEAAQVAGKTSTPSPQRYGFGRVRRARD